MTEPAPTATAAGPASSGAASQPARRSRVLDVQEPSSALPLPELLKQLALEHGKPLTQVVTEIAKLSFAPGHVTAEEYFTLRLFDDEALAGADKKTFLGMRGCKAVALKANRNTHWFALVGEKLPFYAAMTGFGLPTIRGKALYHPALELPALKSLATPEALTAFLADPASYPLFGKPVGGSLSLGTVAIEGCDPSAGTLRLSGGRTARIEDLVADITRSYASGYLFQEKLVPHPGLAALCGDRIGTIRVYTMVGPAGPRVFRTCWKVPAGANMADNFWRSGNMLAALDAETGTIHRVIRGSGLKQQELQCHPDTGARMVGTAIPGWAEIMHLALWAAKVVEAVPLIGWDIALTDRGPVLVEANNTPDFRLVQMAERRGVYDGPMQAFLEHVALIYADAEDKLAARDRGLRRKGFARVLATLRRTG